VDDTPWELLQTDNLEGITVPVDGTKTHERVVFQESSAASKIRRDNTRRRHITRSRYGCLNYKVHLYALP
jgi:hypothetical protein